MANDFPAGCSECDAHREFGAPSVRAGEKKICDINAADQKDEDYAALQHEQRSLDGVHSLGLHGHETKIWGEADIVVLSTKGFFSLEVKGGKVSCLNGVWTFGEPGGLSYQKREDPWTQAKGTLFAVRQKLIEADAAFANVLDGFGVVMPMETFTMTGADSIVYEFTWEDPVVFTAPWSARLDWVRDDDFGIYEYACHEGNVQIRNFITASRAERAQAAAGGSSQ